MDRQKLLAILQNAPKQFCEDVIVGSNQETFYIIMLSGQNATGFSMTPEHAKRFLGNLKDKVEAFEKEHRSLKTEWSKNPPSPIQITDLKPPQGGED